MTITNPRLLPFPLANTDGSLTAAGQINIDNTSFTGLLSSVTNTQAMAAIVDGLMTGGTPGMVSAVMVSVDDSAFGSVNADNAQEGFAELERLYNIVAGSQPGAPSTRFGGQFTPFVDSINVGPANFAQYAGRTALYSRSNDQRVGFILPTDAEITAEGVANDELVEFAVLNQAGTARFDTGGGAQGPNNTVRIDVEGANNIRRNTETGTLLNFVEAHQNDFVVLRQAERGSPWVSTLVTLSSAALLLPTGLFNLQVGTRVTLNPVLGFIAGIPSGTIVQAGFAYEVSTGNDNFGGYGVSTGDVIVALRDNPSRVISATNADWLVSRNATNDIISLAEIHFLNTVTETDAFEDDRLIDRSDVNDVNVFLANGILDHAPHLTPSTDSDNPQTDGTRYVGGNEDVSAGNEFHLTDFTKLGEPAGSSRAPNLLVYFDVDGGVMQPEILQTTFLVLKNGQGEEISRFNGATQFRAIVLPDTSDTYYVLDLVGASDNFSTINYLSGYTIELVERRTLRSFTLSEAVNVLASIPEGSVPLSKLEPNVQALITSDHSLTDEQETILDGFQTTGTATPWTAGPLYVRDTDASPTSDLGHYYNVDQRNGFFGSGDHTRNVTFVVPNFVTVAGLVDTENDSNTLSVTRIGAVTIQDNTQNPPTTFNGQGFTAVLPASNPGPSNPLGTIWVVDGTASNLFLTGAVDTFKINRPNVSDALATWVQSLVPDTPTPVSLPENLQQFSRHLTVNTDTSSGWANVEPNPIRADVVRQFAALWDENRRTFGTDNYFSDLSGIETIGYGSNNVFWYREPSDPLNRSFPGAQSYILNSNIRIRNQSGQTTIGDSFRKIVSFDYALSAPLPETTNQNMLRIGSSSSTAFMGISGQEGLFLNIGRQDGGQRTRTIQENLDVIDGHWSTIVGQSEIGEAEVIIPESLTGSLAVTVEFELDNNGNDQGTHTETVTISNVGADGGLSVNSFNVNHTLPGGPISRTVNLVYDHDNTDLSNTRRVLFLRPTQPFTNGALTYNVAAHYDRTETWNVPATYAEEPVNAGSGHDDYGLFDPHLYTTEQIHERNRIIVSFMKWDENDQSADPELACHIVVDGETESGFGTEEDPFRIRLHRPASEFSFDDMSFGNNSSAISHIQVYEYDGQPPSEQELQRLYAHQNNWLGLFWPAGHAVDDVVIDAQIEVTAGHSLILTDVSTGNRRIIEVDNGVITNKDA